MSRRSRGSARFGQPLSPAAHPFNKCSPEFGSMRPYLATVRRYAWLVGAILALVWGAGLASAYVDYTTTFESEATIWVLRASPELLVTSPNDPSAPILQTAASQQADLLDQLLQTQSFVRDVVQKTSLAPALAAAQEARRFRRGERRSAERHPAAPTRPAAARARLRAGSARRHQRTHRPGDARPGRPRGQRDGVPSR